LRHYNHHHHGRAILFAKCPEGICVHAKDWPTVKSGGTLNYWWGCSEDRNKFFLKNVQTGLCLHTVGSSAQNGDEMVFMDGCSGDKNKLEMVDAGGSAFYLKNAQTGRCLHTKDKKANKRGKIVFWDGCRGKKNKFKKVQG